MRARYYIPAIFLVAIAANLLVVYIAGAGKPVTSDASYFRDLARNLANGKGYVHSTSHSFWPGKPTMQRSPGWPLVISIAFRLSNGVNESWLMRVLDALVNSGAAILVALLALWLFRNAGVACLAGLLYVLHPTALYLMSNGDSEPLFVALSVLGILGILAGRGGTLYQLGRGRLVNSDTLARVITFIGFIFLGFACLVRAEFLSWIVVFIFLAVVMNAAAGAADQPAGRRIGSVLLKHSVTLTAGSLLFLAPATFWALRNYGATSCFPVLNTQRGAAFYGGNNIVTATNGIYWGYWVFPNDVPGEKTLYELSRTLSEQEVDQYYFDHGKAFIADNFRRLPGMLAGKLVRAYVPIPWKLSAGTAGVSAYRWLLLIAGITGLVLCWRKTDPLFKVCFLAAIASNVFLVLVFYGCARFAFTVEPFLIPFAAYAAVRIAGGYRTRILSE